jgi:hypothetical protein
MIPPPSLGGGRGWYDLFMSGTKVLNLNHLEKYLYSKIFPDLAEGRPSDKPHTELVVAYVKMILKYNPDIDPVPVIIAAYAHDWGYTHMFGTNTGLSLAEIGAKKDLHMQFGAEKLARLLSNSVFDQLTPNQKNRSVHLVKVHDNLKSIKDLDEIILMEADTLAGLEPDIMGKFRDPDSEARFLKKNRELRFPLFKNKYSLNEYERLYLKRQKA